jgi:hypothetical protein
VALLEQATALSQPDFPGMQEDPDLEALRSHPGFVALLSRGRLDRRYAGTWHASTAFESQGSQELAPGPHRERCRAQPAHETGCIPCS